MEGNIYIKVISLLVKGEDNAPEIKKVLCSYLFPKALGGSLWSHLCECDYEQEK
jgi:hypothetical protein